MAVLQSCQMDEVTFRVHGKRKGIIGRIAIRQILHKPINSLYFESFRMQKSID